MTPLAKSGHFFGYALKSEVAGSVSVLELPASLSIKIRLRLDNKQDSSSLLVMCYIL